MATINIRQLAKTVAADTTRPEDVVKEILQATFETLARSLASGDRFVLTNFGALEPRERQAHRARNPQTGAVVEVPATTVISFHATGTLRQMVRDGDATRSIRKKGNKG